MRNFHKPYQLQLIALSSHLVTCQQMFALTSTMLSHTLFSEQLGKTDVSNHVINTGDARFPHVPSHFTMLTKFTINFGKWHRRESSEPIQRFMFLWVMENSASALTLFSWIGWQKWTPIQFPGLRGHSSSLQENVSSPSLTFAVLIGSSPWTIIQLRRLHIAQDQAMDSGSSQWCPMT